MPTQTTTNHSDSTAVKRPKKATHDSPDQPDFGDIASFVDIQRDIFEHMAASNLEMIDFVNRRMQAGADAMRDISACKDWREIAETQNRFIAETTKDYAEHAVKLMQAMAIRISARRASREG